MVNLGHILCPMEARNDPFSWQERAACKDAPTAYFFEDEKAGKNISTNGHKKYCDPCPVRWDCLYTGNLYNFDGVWGGLKEDERRELYGSEYRAQLREELAEIGEYKKLPHVA